MKIRRPGEVPESKGPAPRPYDKAKEAAREKAFSEYFELECHHFTTWRDDELWSHWRPHKYLYWCETCGRWRDRLHKEKATDVPDVPLF